MKSLGNAVVFIDNGYFKLITKDFGYDGKSKENNFKKCDINQFAITLARSEGFWCEHVYFYIAPPFQSFPPTPDEKLRKAHHDKFIHFLRTIPNFTVREGRCQKIDGKYKQKGVDTLMVMDLTKFFYNHQKTKTIIIITSDTDFVPVLNELRKSGINVILYHFTDKIRKSKFSMSNHLSKACDKCVMITKEHYEKSVRRKKL